MQLDDYFVNGFENFLITSVLIIIVYFIIWYSIEKKIAEFNRHYPERSVSIPFVSSAVRFAFFLIGFIIIMNQIIPLKPALELLLDAGGILAICVTFAARESFSNYIAGFLITIHKPFKIGDKVCLQSLEITGTVKDISFRHTTLETESGSIITVPNAIMNSIAIEDLDSVREVKRKKKREN